MRFTFLAIIAAATIIAGCSSDNGTSNQNQGSLQVFLTDSPINLDQVCVTITDVEVHQTGADWQTISSNQQNLDLLTLKNTQSLIASAQLQNGNYTGIRLDVTEGHIVDANGNTCNLKVPSSKIQIPVNFEIKEGKMTGVVLDFNAEQSVHVTKAGSSEQCILRPVIKPVSVS